MPESPADKQSDIVERLIKDPANLPSLSRVVGYVGKSTDEKKVRLYTNLSFNEYYDIPKEKIVHVEDTPEGVMEFGGKYVWVSKDTDIKYTKIDSTVRQAEFLQGGMRKSLISRYGKGGVPSVMYGRGRRPGGTPEHTSGFFCGWTDGPICDVIETIVEATDAQICETIGILTEITIVIFRDQPNTNKFCPTNIINCKGTDNTKLTSISDVTNLRTHPVFCTPQCWYEPAMATNPKFC